MTGTDSAREIQWPRDVVKAMAEAAAQHRPVLLDFTAAPA
jgi:hypothetical protein